MNKMALLLSALCLHSGLTLAQSTTPEGDGTRVDDRTERRIERRAAAAAATPEERMAKREERRAKVADYVKTNPNAAERAERREGRRLIRQETRGN